MVLRCFKDSTEGNALCVFSVSSQFEWLSNHDYEFWGLVDSYVNSHRIKYGGLVNWHFDTLPLFTEAYLLFLLV